MQDQRRGLLPRQGTNMGLLMTTDIQAQIAEILAGHHFIYRLKYTYVCSCAPKGGFTEEGFYAHQAEQLAGIVREVQAGAVEESSAYLERINPKGLTPTRAVLADLAVVSHRMANGRHANGNYRASKFRGES